MKVIDYDYIFLDNTDRPEPERIKLRVYKNRVPKKDLNALNSSTARLLRITGGGVTKHKKTRQFGAWCCYKDCFYITSDTKKSEACEIFLANQELWSGRSALRLERPHRWIITAYPLWQLRRWRVSFSRFGPVHQMQGR